MVKLKVHYERVDFQPSDIKKYLPDYCNVAAEMLMALIIEFSIEENHWVAVSVSDLSLSMWKIFIKNYFSHAISAAYKVFSVESMFEGYDYLFSNKLLDLLVLRDDLYLKPTEKAILLLKKFKASENWQRLPNFGSFCKNFFQKNEKKWNFFYSNLKILV